MVAGGFVFAASHLLGNRATVSLEWVMLLGCADAVYPFPNTAYVLQHPMVEAGQSQKNDSLAEEREGSHESGKKHFESSGRQASRKTGFHEGQVCQGTCTS